MFAITQVHESVGLSTKDSVKKAASAPVLRVFGLQMKTLWGFCISLKEKNY